jgi:hypothetical protein
MLDGGMFWVCEFENEIMGLLLAVKLKQSVFDDMMEGLRQEKDLREGDFAALTENGSIYIVSFFALNKKVASMLFVRYYAHLISHQDYINDLGAATMMQDGKQLIESIGIPFYKTNKIFNDNVQVDTFKASLSNFLSESAVVKMIFSKQNCEIE